MGSLNRLPAGIAWVELRLFWRGETDRGTGFQVGDDSTEVIKRGDEG